MAEADRAASPPPSLAYRVCFGAGLALLAGSMVVGIVQRVRLGVADEISFDPLREAGDLLNAGRPAEAAERFRLAASLDRSRDAQLGLARSLTRAGDTGNGLAEYGRLPRIAPRDAQAINEYADVLLAAGRTTEAEAWLRHALQLDPRLADAYNNLGIVFARTGRLEGAVQLLEKAAALSAQPDAEIEANLLRVRAALQARSAAAAGGRP
jgi:Flp pilus assembly protein TadD